MGACRLVDVCRMVDVACSLMGWACRLAGVASIWLVCQWVWLVG